MDLFETPLAPPVFGNGSRKLSDDEMSLLRLADQCVKCGYCLPHCPTYRLRHDEAESPRGRVSLIQGLLWGELEPSPRLSRHLDNCLECRACEPVCPSMVQFGTLMDGARALQRAAQPPLPRGLAATLLDLLSDRRRLPRLARLAALYHRSGIGRAAAALGLLRPPRLALLHRLSALLRPPQSLPSMPAKTNPPGPEVDLFLGCIATSTQQPTAAAALQVLRRLGLRVRVPDRQVCCGAMHRHNGLTDAAEEHVQRNRRIFADRRVVGYASACVAELREHGAMDAVELCRLLVDTPWPEDLELHPCDQRIAVHEPCSHRNVLRDTAAIYALLAKIPGCGRSRSPATRLVAAPRGPI